MNKVYQFIANRYLYSIKITPRKIILTGLVWLLLLGMLFLFFSWYPHSLILGGTLILTSLIFCVLLLSFISSIFNTVATVGIALGVASLFVVISLISGYYQEIQQRLVGFYAHISIDMNEDEKRFDSVLPTISNQPHIIGATPTLYPQMFISKIGFPSTVVIVKGIDTDYAPKVVNMNEWLITDQNKTPSVKLLAETITPHINSTPLPTIFVGEGIAKKLKLHVGDIVSLKGKPLTGNKPSDKAFYIAALLRSGFEDYDQHFVCVSLEEAKNLSSIGPVKKAIEIRIDNINRADQITTSLALSLNLSSQKITTWKSTNPTLFQALEIQKAILALIMFLIILVASFNMIASLTMIVTEKTKEIAILKSMGIPNKGISSIFRFMGLHLGLQGIVIGLCIGWLTIQVIQKLAYALPSEIYKVDKLPIKPSIIDMGVIFIVTILVCWLATLYPSSKAYKLLPVNGLRYE